MGKIYATKNPEMSEREKRNMERLRTLASQGMVLLENDGTLPITDKRKGIALYGVGARKTVKGETGSGDVNSRYVIPVEQGLENAGFRITTKKWLDEYDRLAEEAYLAWGRKGAEDIRNGVSPLIYLMEKSFKTPQPQPITEEDVVMSETDTAIYVISRNSGEGADRYNIPGDYQLSREEEENLKFLTQRYEKVVVVLNTGGIMDTRFLRQTPGIGAVLLMSQAGNISGDAVADIISGRVNPSGKLSDTWAENYEDYPFSDQFSHNDGDVDDAYYNEGIYVGYRYFDTFNITPAYCFGYGLSYTRFTIRTGKPELCGEDLLIRAAVSNIGSCEGREVVQVYCSAPGSAGDMQVYRDTQAPQLLEKPYQRLAAFAKTAVLKPGEEQELTLRIPIRELASYCESSASWILEEGFYYFRVGNSSRHTEIAGAVRLNGTVVTEKDKNLFPLDCELKELTSKGIEAYSYPGEEGEKQRARDNAIAVEPEAIKTKETAYRGKHRILVPKENGKKITVEDVREGREELEQLVASLTVEELAELCVGKVKEGFSAIGNACTTVPGAAGDTTDSMTQSRGIRSMILADGPAGLRLTNKFEVDEEGNIGGDGGFDTLAIMREAMEATMPGRKLGEKTETYYQYCTAIPIATLLAQSWDMELIEECGSIVGEEMEEFGITLWLAPGMNIHRNPLCGRNFEYYSEDPLLSGMCAAADTKGVQSHPGVGTTIKHFATNNQEDNRSFENNHVGERALREIYLKGFEVCIKTARPMSIMTSYNLLNGVHTANRYDMLTSAARDEWGFDGIVMTDWGTTGSMSLFNTQPKYPSSSAAMCIQAGNDLIMPGTKEDIEEIVKAVREGGIHAEGLRNGSLSLGDLQFCAGNILRLCMQTSCYEGAKPYTLTEK